MINNNLEFHPVLNQWFSAFCSSRLFLGAQYCLRLRSIDINSFEIAAVLFFDVYRAYYEISVDTV